MFADDARGFSEAAGAQPRQAPRPRARRARRRMIGPCHPSPSNGQRPAPAPDRFRTNVARHRVVIDRATCTDCGICADSCRHYVHRRIDGKLRLDEPLHDRCRAGLPRERLVLRQGLPLGGDPPRSEPTGLALGDRRWTADLMRETWRQARTGDGGDERRGRKGGRLRRGIRRPAARSRPRPARRYRQHGSLARAQPAVSGPRITLSLPIYGGGMSFGSVSVQAMLGRAMAAQGARHLHLDGRGGLSRRARPLRRPGHHPDRDRALRRARGDDPAGEARRVQVRPGRETGPGRPPPGRQEHPARSPRCARPCPGRPCSRPSRSTASTRSRTIKSISTGCGRSTPTSWFRSRSRRRSTWIWSPWEATTPGPTSSILTAATAAPGRRPNRQEEHRPAHRVRHGPGARFPGTEGIRDEVVLMVSGGMRTAEDALKAVALGADGVVIGTAELVAIGCVRCGNCERDRGCPNGIATTDPGLCSQLTADWVGDRIVNLYPSWAAHLEATPARPGAAGASRSCAAGATCCASHASADAGERSAQVPVNDTPAIVARAASSPGCRPSDARSRAAAASSASSGPSRIAGRCIIRSCEQMRNRGNGKGGGVAAVGLFGELQGRTTPSNRVPRRERAGGAGEEFLRANSISRTRERQQSLDDHRAVGSEVRPPVVWRYFARARADRARAVRAARDPRPARRRGRVRLPEQLPAQPRVLRPAEPPRAFVLSHGRDLMILKAVGFAEQVARYYRLEEAKAHVWIGHQRYPTRGRVWHPGGAHPFAGLHEALVHNGDFANYYAVTEYLRQRGIVPLFVTDTEVSVLLFDLYARVLGYPLEFVIEALAPTPEGDFERLSKRRQRIYRAIQSGPHARLARRAVVLHRRPGRARHRTCRSSSGSPMSRCSGRRCSRSRRANELRRDRLGEAGHRCLLRGALARRDPHRPGRRRPVLERAGRELHRRRRVRLQPQAARRRRAWCSTCGTSSGRRSPRPAVHATGRGRAPAGAGGSGSAVEVGAGPVGAGLNPGRRRGPSATCLEEAESRGPVSGQRTSLVAERRTTAAPCWPTCGGAARRLFTAACEKIAARRRAHGRGGWRSTALTLPARPALAARRRATSVAPRGHRQGDRRSAGRLPAPGAAGQNRRDAPGQRRAPGSSLCPPHSADCVLVIDARGFPPEGPGLVSRAPGRGAPARVAALIV